MNVFRTRTALFDWPDGRNGPFEAGGLCAVGAPTDHGNAISRGAAHGPEAIRRASLLLAPPRTGGLDWGDIERSDSTDLASFLDRIAHTTMLIHERALCPLLLGGDHSITYAPVSALQCSRDLCLIWFDAHTDFSPWPGQGCHNHKQVLRRISKLDGVRRIVQIGYRGITTGDERSLGNKSVVVTSAHARALDAQALLALVPADMPCYISIDIDVVDPLWAPGTSAPVPDGLLPEQVRDMLRTIVRNRKIAGVDLVEVNPKLDLQAATSLIAADLIREIADNWHCQVAPARLAGPVGLDMPVQSHGEAIQSLHRWLAPPALS